MDHDLIRVSLTAYCRPDGVSPTVSPDVDASISWVGSWVWCASHALASDFAMRSPTRVPPRVGSIRFNAPPHMAEKDALWALREAQGSNVSEDSRIASWTYADNHCDWAGIQCSTAGQVTKL